MVAGALWLRADARVAVAPAPTQPSIETATQCDAGEASPLPGGKADPIVRVPPPRPKNSRGAGKAPAPTACESFQARLQEARAAWTRRKQQAQDIPDADLLEQTLRSLEARSGAACESDASLAKMDRALTDFAEEALGTQPP
jgi:hypothetical protein